MTDAELFQECERLRLKVIQATELARLAFKTKEALLQEMAAISEYLKPNLSNDLPWPDEIIIAIDARVLTAQMDAGHDAIQALSMKRVLESYEQWEADLLENDDHRLFESMPTDFYNRLTAIQTARNEVLGR